MTAPVDTRYLILADDLTGAGDTAIALAGQDGEAHVYLDELPAALAPMDGASMDRALASIADASAHTASASTAGSSADIAVAPVTAIDLHTRDLTVDDACRRVASTAARIAAGTQVYKKIDSTLRGHIGAELAALCANLPHKDAGGPLLCIVAPAFPAVGRTIEGGELHINGKPVDAVALWGAGAPRSKGGIGAELRAYGFACLSLHLADIRAGQEADLAGRMARILRAGGLAAKGSNMEYPDTDNPAMGTAAIVCDAASMDDMRRIVGAARSLPARCLWVGSAGLGHALADNDARDATSTFGEQASALTFGEYAAAPPSSGQPTACASNITAVRQCAVAAADERPLAFVVGSFSAVAAEQVRGLVEGGHAAHVALPVDELIGDIGAATARRIDGHLAAGRDLVLSIPRDEVRPELAQRLSAGMARVARGILPGVSALVCCGGDTSRALLDRMGVRRLRVRRCAEPGAAMAWCDAHPDLPLVMKAGAFGDAQALVRLRQELRAAPPAARHTPERHIPASHTPASHTLASHPLTRGITVESTATSSAGAATRPIVAITMGDAAGIGPEIIARALASEDVYRTCRPLVIGDANRLEQAVRIVGKTLDVRRVSGPADGRYAVGAIDCVDLALIPPDTPFGVLSAVCGDAAYRFIERAVQLAVAREVDAICTAPLNKEALHAGGHIYPGHTELLAELTGTPEVSMMLSSPQLKVIHVTTHVGLLDAIERIEPQLVGRVIQRIHDTLRLSGIESPHIGVCGINPHAGENGLFGRGEEGTKIVPAIDAARARGIDVEGPLPADTLFFRAARGDFDGVVAMYHDQGHGPVKVMGLEAGVNVTIGLPVIRTSVDHGTAFDIAGKGVADERSLIEALRQAIALAPRGRA